MAHEQAGDPENSEPAKPRLGGGKPWHVGHKPAPALTSPSLFTIEYIHAPPALVPFVTTLYHFRCDEPQFEDIQPASIGQLTLFPYGQGQMLFRDGRCEPSHEVNLLAPLSVAARISVRGPFHAIGAVLSPLGWAALTGLPVDRYGNHLYRAADHMGADIERTGAELCARYRCGALSGAAVAAELAALIQARLRPVAPRHAKLIEHVSRWLSSELSPDLEAVHMAANYSPRQVQRLVERYFGLPPVTLLRKYRALRAAALLSLPDLSDEAAASLAEAFYDQSHLIREIQLFAGRTPARLGVADAPYLTEMLSLRNFREIAVGAQHAS